jgi:hypothetical protein
MTIYKASIQAKVSVVLCVIADSLDEASEKAEMILRNDVPHDVEVMGVDLEERQS